MFKKLLTTNKGFIIVFFAVFAGYLINLPTDYMVSLKTRTYRRLLTSYDVTAATFMPYEIIKKGTLSFSKETIEAMKRVQDPNVYSVIKVGEKNFSSYPILMGVMAVPIYLIPILLNKIPELHYVEDLLKIIALARITASFYTALAVAFFYLIIKEVNRLKNIKITKLEQIILIAFYAFGTNLYSIASRSLWQHTSSLLFITIIILLLIKSLNDEKYVKWLGTLTALLFIARPLNIIFVVIISLYVLIKHKKQFLNYILFALPFALLLFAYNYYAFGNPITNEYIFKGDTQFSTPLLEGLAGNLFSPARSFLFITPPLLLGYFGIIKTFLKKKKEPIDIILLTLSLTYLIALITYSKWWCWYGADRFGYGFFTEWVPIITLLGYTAVIEKKSLVLKIALILLIIYSIYAQSNAVWFRKSRCSGLSHNWSFYCLKPGILTKQEY